MTMVRRRRFLQMAMSAGATPWILRAARAQDYPTRPLRWIIGFPPGGGADVVARIMTPWLSDQLGQQVILEHKPGAGMSIAAQAAANSAPDGYTLLFVGTANAVNPALYDSLPYNFLRDIAPVAGLVLYPVVLVVHPSFPAKSVSEFLDHAKANPGKVNLASFGIGTISHLAGELFKSMTGANLVHVPYRGGAAMVTDLLGGQVPAAFDVVANSLPHIRSGSLRALAVTTSARLEVLPDVPTIGETVPGYEVVAWTGIGVPSGTPRAIIERLNREVNAGLANPGIKSRLAELTVVPTLYRPDEFGAHWTAETEKWSKVIRAAGIKAQ
jgi:tripartite-type tricarboxylate transporter receptor subunit TctC